MQAFTLRLGFEQMRKPGCQNTGFPGSRTSQNQQRPIQRFNSVALLGIQVIKICRGRSV